MTTISQNNGKVTTTVEEESPLEKSRRTLANLRDKIAAEEARKAKEKTRQEREKSEEFLRQRLQDAARQRANVASSLEETTTLVEEMAKTWREARALGLHEEPEVEAIGQEIVNLREKQEALRKELTTAIAAHEEAKRKLEAVVAAKQPTAPVKTTVPVIVLTSQRSNDEINWGKTSAQLAIEQAETPTLELVLAMCAESTLPRHLQGIGGYIRSLPAENRNAAKQAQDAATERISALYYARQHAQANSSQQPAKTGTNLDEIRRELALLRTELSSFAPDDMSTSGARKFLKEAEYKASFDEFPSKLEEALTLVRQGRTELKPILEEIRQTAKTRRAANLAARQTQAQRIPKGPSPSADKYGSGGQKGRAKDRKILNRRRAGK